MENGLGKELSTIAIPFNQEKKEETESFSGVPGSEPFLRMSNLSKYGLQQAETGSRSPKTPE